MYEQMFYLQAEVMRALAHSRRLEIIQLLRGQELPVTDIYRMLDLPQANVSQHLAILREAGVLTARKKGKQVYYRVAADSFLAAVDQIRSFLVRHFSSTKMADELAIRMNELLPVVHDPVCGMRVSPKTAGDAVGYRGKTFYFCASGCVKKFKKNPVKYVSDKE